MSDRSHPVDSLVTRLSCDAVYSGIRIGKQQMASRPFWHFDKHIKDRSTIRHVLDMRSARGHFALRAVEYFGLDTIFCIEPDAYMVLSYRDNPRITLIETKYYEYRPDRPFDLVYSCHTLEHFRDPVRYLDYVTQVLRDGGLFFLEVPNLQNIAKGGNYDEYFYDKHLFYFTSQMLRDYLSVKGFSVVSCEDSSSSIEILLRWNSKDARPWQPDESLRTSAKEARKLLLNYQSDIESNRNRVPKIVKDIDYWASRHKAPVIFGAGRLLDCFIEYGELDIARFRYLVDNYLKEATTHIRKVPLQKEEILRADSSIDGILILTRFRSKDLVSHIRMLAPHAEIVHLSDFAKNETVP